MRIVVCVKWVPVLAKLQFDPETRRLVREGVPGEVSGFDLRALVAAVVLRDAHGGEVVAVTMGPPGARDALAECLALGADRAVHLSDRALAGSDTLATSHALAAVVRREAPDLVLMGRASTDAETGQVGPETAELLDLPQATNVRRLTVDPAARTFTAERETDDGFETVAGPLPALVTAAEDIAEERHPTKADRQAAAEKPIATLSLADVDLPPSAVGAEGSPTWVVGVEPVASARRGEIVEGDGPEGLAEALGARLRALLAALPAREAPALPPAAAGDGPALWVVVERGPRAIRPVTFELLAKAADLAARFGGRVEAVVLGAGGYDGRAGAVDAAALAAAGADRVLVAAGPHLAPYTTEAHAAVLADAIRRRAPRLVLLGSTTLGRDLAPRVAARLGLGLTGDAIDLDVDSVGRIRQVKPAFGGTIVAPIVSSTRPEMATVRAGVLPAARPDPARRPVVEPLDVPAVTSRVRVTGLEPLPSTGASDLDDAALVLGIGRGVGEGGVATVAEAARRLGAALAATREVTDLGWLPRQLQVGLTGRSIAPRVYVALGVGGAMEHLIGIRRAGVIVAVNKNAKAPIFKAADLGVVSDWAALLPRLEPALRV
jgi:electron transfer flavoprotein alpha subunit